MRFRGSGVCKREQGGGFGRRAIKYRIWWWCDAINRLSAARINCGRGDNLSRARLPEIFHQRWILFVVSREITRDNLFSLFFSRVVKIWKWRRIRCPKKVAVSRETHRDEKGRERESIGTMGAVTWSSRGLTLARGYFDGGDKRARGRSGKGIYVYTMSLLVRNAEI